MKTMSKWVYAGSCANLVGAAADHETISLHGVNPWPHHWKAQRGGVPIVLRDPESASREIWAQVYQIEPEGRPLTFAAGTFPDERWCFFLPADPRDRFGERAREPRFEGHWRDLEADDSEVPWPASTPDWPGRAAFLAALDLLEAESERIIYRGTSRCRLCGLPNGHEAFRARGREWPAGFRHYVTQHDVRPAPGFEAFVRSQDRDAYKPRFAGMDTASCREVFLLSLPSIGHPYDLRPASVQPFVCLLAMDATGIEAALTSPLQRFLLDEGCVYFCTWGPDCERIHDLMDEEIVGFGFPKPGEGAVITTAHAGDTLEQAIDFLLDLANPDRDLAPDGCRAALIITAASGSISTQASSWILERQATASTSIA